MADSLWAPNQGHSFLRCRQPLCHCVNCNRPSFGMSYDRLGRPVTRLPGLRTMEIVDQSAARMRNFLREETPASTPPAAPGTSDSTKATQAAPTREEAEKKATPSQEEVLKQLTEEANKKTAKTEADLIAEQEAILRELARKVSVPTPTAPRPQEQTSDSAASKKRNAESVTREIMDKQIFDGHHKIRKTMGDNNLLMVTKYTTSFFSPAASPCPPSPQPCPQASTATPQDAGNVRRVIGR